MQVMFPRCAGLDVHKDLVVAAVRIAHDQGAHYEVRTFATTTANLMEMAQWLSEFECTHVAMEATGVYWKPVWHILEDSFQLILANAQHIKNVPGRKTDVNDATWISDLLAHGLIRSSFVPPQPIQALRDLTRTRKQLSREVAQHTLRLQKVLEDANIKLSSVLTDILGRSGRDILGGLINGETDPVKLASLAHRSLSGKQEQLIAALHGRITAHHRFLLNLHLSQADTLLRAIQSVDDQLCEMLLPFRIQVDLLMTIPGVGATIAEVIVSEIGMDMSRFPSAGHLVSWAGLCPKLDQSAGKTRSTRTRHGAPWLKTILVQAAWAATRATKSYLRAQFFRLRSRRGPKKAIVAVASSILTAAYHMLLRGVPFHDLGADYFDQHDKTRTVRRLLQRLEDLGIHVTQTQPDAALAI